MKLWGNVAEIDELMRGNGEQARALPSILDSNSINILLMNNKTIGSRRVPFLASTSIIYPIMLSTSRGGSDYADATDASVSLRTTSGTQGVVKPPAA